MNIHLRCSRSAATKLLFTLLAVELVFVGLYVALWVVGDGGRGGALASLVNLDGELNIPTWFSSVQLFVTGALFAVAARQDRRPLSVPSSFLYALGGAFAFLSMDEGASVHERISDLVREHEISWLLIEGHGAWMIVYAVLGGVFVLASLPHILACWRYARRMSITIAFGAGVFVLGAVGFELASYLLLREGGAEHLYYVEVALEEFFELSGGSIMLFGALLFASEPMPITPGARPGRSGTETNQEKRFIEEGTEPRI